MMQVGKTILAVGALTLVVGCGVKNAPAQPEGSTYPYIYPNPDAVGSSDSAAQAPAPVRNRQAPGARTDADGFYVPPPPATQLPR